jgi:NAD(P)-dependent dehydrogenase (short-subunit alcohol dehydrogenase family)
MEEALERDRHPDLDPGRLSLGPRGIRINCVSPVLSPLLSGWAREASRTRSRRRPGVDPDTARKNVFASIGGLVTGRLTKPEEVAMLVVLLASPRTGNVTGSNYLIDGELIKTT